MLLTVHLAAAKLLDTPELQLADEEAAVLAGAVQKVSEQYELAALNPKVLAWLNLGMVAGSIYGTRIYAIRTRQKQQAKEQPRQAPAAGPARVVNMQGNAKQANGAAAATPADVFGVGYSGAIPAEL